MADEYIKRDLVIELLEAKQRAICPVGRCGRGYVYGRDRDEYDAIDSDIDAVQNIPSADVSPVVHGKWVRINQYDKESNVKCSACNEEFDYIDGICYLCIGHELPLFCPYCGVKMDL